MTMSKRNETKGKERKGKEGKGKEGKGRGGYRLTMSSLLPFAESFSIGKCARMTQVLALRAVMLEV